MGWTLVANASTRRPARPSAAPSTQRPGRQSLVAKVARLPRAVPGYRAADVVRRAEAAEAAARAETASWWQVYRQDRAELARTQAALVALQDQFGEAAGRAAQTQAALQPASVEPWHFPGGAPQAARQQRLAALREELARTDAEVCAVERHLWGMLSAVSTAVEPATQGPNEDRRAEGVGTQVAAGAGNAAAVAARGDADGSAAPIFSPDAAGGLLSGWIGRGEFRLTAQTLPRRIQTREGKILGRMSAVVLGGDPPRVTGFECDRDGRPGGLIPVDAVRVVTQDTVVVDAALAFPHIGPTPRPETRRGPLSVAEAWPAPGAPTRRHAETGAGEAEPGQAGRAAVPGFEPGTRAAEEEADAAATPVPGVSEAEAVTPVPAAAVGGEGDVEAGEGEGEVPTPGAVTPAPDLMQVEPAAVSTAAMTRVADGPAWTRATLGASGSVAAPQVAAAVAVPCAGAPRAAAEDEPGIVAAAGVDDAPGTGAPAKGHGEAALPQTVMDDGAPERPTHAAATGIVGPGVPPPVWREALPDLEPEVLPLADRGPAGEPTPPVLPSGNPLPEWPRFQTPAATAAASVPTATAPGTPRTPAAPPPAPLPPPGPVALGVGPDVVAFLIGKLVGRDVRDGEGHLIAEQGRRIDAELVRAAEAAGCLADLIVHMELAAR